MAPDPARLMGSAVLTPGQGEPVRVAYLLADQGIPYQGSKGASIHVRAITAALAGLGHEVVCFVACQGEGPAAPTGVSVHEVKLEPFTAGLLSGLGGGVASARRGQLARREWTGLWLNEAFAAAVQEAHRVRPFDLLLERCSLWSYAGVRLARRLEIPCLLEINAPLPEEQRRYRRLVLEGVARALARQVLASATAVLAVSRQMARLAVEGGAPAERVHVISNGYDPDLILPVVAQRRRRVDSTAGRIFTIGFVGSLKPWHGIEDLCRAFELLSRRQERVQLLLVGEGPLAGWVRQFALRSHLAHRIHLTGRVRHAAVAAHLSRIDLAVAPYPQTANFYFSPLKLFEYMGAGLPVLTTRTGQMEDLLEHGKTGWLVRPGDPAALEAGMARLVGDAALRRALGRAAAQQAISMHRWQDVAQRIVSIAGQVTPLGSGSGGAVRPLSPRCEAV